MDGYSWLYVLERAKYLYGLDSSDIVEISEDIKLSSKDETVYILSVLQSSVFEDRYRRVIWGKEKQPRNQQCLLL